jgi:enoyl-[acyl-carrier protein] reductase II
MKTRVTELLKIRYPVFQGGMAWVSDAKLAAAVSNAGGLGIIAAGGAPAEAVEREILALRRETDKPFGLNIMLMSPYAGEVAALACRLKVPAVVTGAGSPGRYMEAFKAAGLKVIPVVPGVALAKRMERLGADAVIAEGGESGGHIGEHNTMSLVPQVVRAVQIPVLAAGGIADASGAAAAFCLGAEGVQCGTVFLAAEECAVHDNYKQMVLRAGDNSTAVTGRSVGLPVRALKNPLTHKIIEMERGNRSAQEIEEFTVGSLRKAARDGDEEAGSFMAGQIAGLISAVRPCREIIESMMSGVETALRRALGLCAGE